MSLTILCLHQSISSRSNISLMHLNWWDHIFKRIIEYCFGFKTRRHDIAWQGAAAFCCKSVYWSQKKFKVLFLSTSIFFVGIFAFFPLSLSMSISSISLATRNKTYRNKPTSQTCRESSSVMMQCTFFELHHRIDARWQGQNYFSRLMPIISRGFILVIASDG